MSAYQRHIVPYLVHLSMRHERLAEYRRRVVPAAKGRVLEIGVGSGLNFRFYPEEATQVVGIDPSSRLLAMARSSIAVAAPAIQLIEGSAEALPLDDESVDTVVSTWTLCSIADVERALGEVHRVLRSSGRLLFVEHGQAPDANVSRWQGCLTPIWKRFAGGCHLDRRVDEIIQTAGFRLERLQTGYMEGPKLLTFFYEGAAMPV